MGKTYRMLEDGQPLREQGVDVVIGYFEPHARKDTISETEGLESYHGIRLNIEATLRRNGYRSHPGSASRHLSGGRIPALEHPGADRSKRWEDVDHLLEEGIDISPP